MYFALVSCVFVLFLFSFVFCRWHLPRVYKLHSRANGLLNLFWFEQKRKETQSSRTRQNDDTFAVWLVHCGYISFRRSMTCVCVCACALCVCEEMLNLHEFLFIFCFSFCRQSQWTRNRLWEMVVVVVFFFASVTFVYACPGHVGARLNSLGKRLCRRRLMTRTVRWRSWKSQYFVPAQCSCPSVQMAMISL